MGGQLRTPKLSLEGGSQLRTPKLTLADAGGAPLVTLSLLLCFFLYCGFPKPIPNTCFSHSETGIYLKIKMLIFEQCFKSYLNWKSDLKQEILWNSCLKAVVISVALLKTLFPVGKSTDKIYHVHSANWGQGTIFYKSKDGGKSFC